MTRKSRLGGIPSTNPKDMSPDLRAKFRYDLRNGMSYDNLSAKYLVHACHIAKEKEILGIPKRTYGKNPKTQLRIVRSNDAPAREVQAPAKPVIPDAREIAAALRSAVKALCEAGYAITISGDAVEIVRREVL